MTPGRFHHLGVACRDLDREEAAFQALGYRGVGGRFEDPVQGVTGVFLEAGGPRLELLSPLPGSTVLDPWLGGGARIYHLAYEVADIRAAMRQAGLDGSHVVVEPVPAVAFGGRRIAFLMLRTRMLIELIERA